MSLAETKNVGTNRYELVVKVDAAQFEAAIEKVYRRNVKKIDVPGFRKGHAPRKVVERMYGEGVFFEDAVNDVYPSALQEAVDESGLEIVARPEVEVTEVSREEGVTFVAKCVVKPEVEVKDYKGIEVEKEVKAVTDEEIDRKLQNLQEKHARMIDVDDRAAQQGDNVVFDFEGFVDGEAFEGGKAEHFSLELGSGQFIPGFEDQIVGKSIGEDFDVNVTFPEDYHAKELAGKAAVFKVKLNEVQYKELPVADDEFAKDVSEYDTLDEFKASIRKNMEEAAEKQAELEVENALVDQLVATLEGDIPPVMIETRIDEMVRDFDYRLSQQGLRLADYLKYIGGDEAKFREGFKEQAEKQVKMRLALEAVAKAENIEASEEDFENEVKRIADTYKMEVEKVRSIIPVAEVKKDLAVNKAIDFIKSKAEITAKKAEEKSE